MWDYTIKMPFLVSMVSFVFNIYYAIKAYKKFKAIDSLHQAMQKHDKEHEEIVLLGLQSIIDQSISDTIEDYELAARAKKLMDKIKNKEA